MNLRSIIALFATMVAAPLAHGQAPDTARILMKTAANYRAASTFRCESAWTHKAGAKEYSASVVLAAKRPNLYRLSITGSYCDTEVWSDGKQLTALRVERNAYTRTAAPQQLIGGDTLKGIAVPTPASRVITLLLEGRWQDRRDDLASRLRSAEVSGPQSFGDQLAWVLSFDYDADHSAKLYIDNDRYLVRRVALFSKGAPVIVETVRTVEIDKPLPTDGFAVKLPDGARQLTALPAPDSPSVPTSITVRTYDDRQVRFSDLRGKMIFLTFFFST